MTTNAVAHDIEDHAVEAVYRAASENLAAYIRLQWPNWIRGRHIEELLKALQRVERGEIDRLIVLMPPRHSKSVSVSQFFPAWYLGRHPDRDIICASYGQDLANDFGLKVRNLIADPTHRMIFPGCVLSSDSAAKDQFGLTAGGRYWAVGRGSATTGRGAHCLVAGTMVATEHGELPIEQLGGLVGTLRVHARSVSAGADVMRRVRAFSAREARGLVIITTRSGAAVTGTMDHRLWLHGDFRPMRDACGRDTLLLRDGTRDEVVSVDRQPEREAVVYDIEVEEDHNFFANGVLSSNCFIVDDPIKDKVEAQSETLRRQLHDWFSTVAYTRLQDPSAIIITQTLWHEDDLAGRQMRDHMDDGWVVVRMPAIAEEDEGWRKAGEALWPEKFPLERLHRIQRQLTTEDWLSLYQQRSVADEGTVFKLQWLEDCYLDPGRELTPTKAAGLTKYITVDPASSKRRGSDYTSMWVLGLGADRCIYVLDVVRDKLTTPAERADALFRLHRKWRPVSRVLYEEYGLMGDVAYIRERQAGLAGQAPYSFRITPVGGTLQKSERIKQLEPFFREGRIRMPRHLEGMSEGKRVDLIQDAFVPEYKAFPSAAHDDMLDAFARLVNDHVTLDWPMTSEEVEEYAAEVEAENERGSWMSQ